MITKLYALLLLSIIALMPLKQLYAAETLLIGIAPHSSARVILQSYATLRSFLEAHFGQPVQIATAPNFTEFARRSQQGQYDLLITSPHLALLAQEEAGYTPLLTYVQGLETVLVSRTEVLPDHRPLNVLGLDPVSFVTLTGLHELNNRGLVAGKDINISYASASDSAALAVTQQKADVAIMSWPNYTKLNDDIKKQVAISWRSAAEPSRIYLAKEDKGVSVTQWRRALDAFTGSPEGKIHLDDNKLKGFRPLKEHELDSVRPLADVTRAILNQPTTAP
jgi:phosphonate transport system substrate-binding protein